MFRAAGWTVGLFGAGMAVCRAFPIPWLEPVVLFGLGIAFLGVSARSSGRPRRSRGLAAKQVAA
jgi:hypothetical protein